tara:strand:- start:569 stop:811 length:243 start_codon:yes stop_codon:yes gene_type:complete
MELIRKISIGPNPKDCMAYSVGQPVIDGSYKITDIVLNDRVMHKTSVHRYDIWVEKNNERFLWKSIENSTCIIENDLKFE